LGWVWGGQGGVLEQAKLSPPTSPIMEPVPSAVTALAMEMATICKHSHVIFRSEDERGEEKEKKKISSFPCYFPFPFSFLIYLFTLREEKEKEKNSAFSLLFPPFPFLFEFIRSLQPKKEEPFIP